MSVKINCGNKSCEFNDDNNGCTSGYIEHDANGKCISVIYKGDSCVDLCPLCEHELILKPAFGGIIGCSNCSYIKD